MMISTYKLIKETIQIILNNIVTLNFKIQKDKWQLMFTMVIGSTYSRALAIFGVYLLPMSQRYYKYFITIVSN